MTRGPNASAEYMKCKDEHSRLEFQVKLLALYQEIFIEFSCGCSIKAEKPMDPFFEPLSFARIFPLGLKKVFGKKAIRKKHSLWSCARFEKTPHRLCPKDPQLFALLIKILYECRLEISDNMAATLSFLKTTDEIPENKMELLEEDASRLKSGDRCQYPAVARDFLMPYFKNNATVPDPDTPYYKDCKLPKKLKEALQVESPEVSEKCLPDEQLVELFKETTTQEHKPKRFRKKPNKGKTQSAIRKTQKPVKL